MVLVNPNDSEISPNKNKLSNNIALSPAYLPIPILLVDVITSTSNFICQAKKRVDNNMIAKLYIPCIGSKST